MSNLKEYLEVMGGMGPKKWKDEATKKSAEEAGLKVHEKMKRLYELKRFAKANGLKPPKFTDLPVDLQSRGIDPNELKMGIEVEKEHTNNEMHATIVAIHHLDEMKDYYSKLKKMEGSSHE